MKALIGLVLGVSFLLIGALFTGANGSIITFDYLLGEINWPLSYLLLSSFAMGLGAAMIIMLPVYLRWKSETIRLQRRLKDQAKEINNLRIMPVQDTI
jgi:uncharacterized membrane protein YciS (DUF1049 family)